MVQVTGGTLDVGGALLALSGRATAVASEVADGTTVTVGTDTPLKLDGTMIAVSGAAVTAQRGVVLDTALLAATAPILDLSGSASLTTAFAALDLVKQSKAVLTGPVVKLDASTLTATDGPAINVAGGSLLRVTGNLFELSNGARLVTSNGAVLSVSGNSVVNVSGALVKFGGSGGNQVNVTNALCPCTAFGGLPIALTAGATAGNVSVGANPIANASLGTLTLSNPVLTSGGTAVAVVSGPSSKLTITAP